MSREPVFLTEGLVSATCLLEGNYMSVHIYIYICVCVGCQSSIPWLTCEWLFAAAFPNKPSRCTLKPLRRYGGFQLGAPFWESLQETSVHIGVHFGAPHVWKSSYMVLQPSQPTSAMLKT